MRSKISTLLILLVMSLSAAANVGFRCPELKTEISRKKVDDLLTLVATHANSGAQTFNQRLVLPEEDTVDAYQERFGHYYIVMNGAQELFPYMPESMLIFHIMRSTKLYKKGIQAFEGKGEAVELPKMYCKAFIKAIEKY
jgi:hypothetical protein